MVRIFSETEKAAIVKMYETTHSTRMVAKQFGVDHKKIAQTLREYGVTPLSKSENAKYTWKNHQHPRTGKKGADCPVYGHKMSDAVREKMRPIWDALGEKRRFGRKEHSDGYILVYVPDHPAADRNGYVLEHRFVVEQSIGRYLSSDEYVHHINGDKQDNRLENLEITNMREHAKIHMKERLKHAQQSYHAGTSCR